MVIMEKKTMGRSKVEMKKIEKIGLFKKPSEICVLTGAEIAIILQSLTRKCVFTFEHSSVDSVIARFKNGITSDGTVKNYA
ncbi:agamous-like MADS-box AGL62, partial [Olea europaea subsp. europaea]